MADSVQTAFLVLRATQYGENSLIAAGISPVYGRLSFMVRGGVGSGRHGSTPFGLFRRVLVSFSPSERDIQTVLAAEAEADYGGLCRQYPRYVCGCWLSQFTLANVLPGMAGDYYFQSLDVALRRLAETDVPVSSVLTGALLVYMQENGLLPPFGGDKRQQAQCQLLLRMALGEDVPPLREDNWLAIRDWTLGVLRQTDCIVPPV